MDEVIIERIYLPSIEKSNILNAIAAKTTRDDVVGFYADCLRCAAIHGNDRIDWKTINAAIIKKWCFHSLNYIKEKAWKELKGNRHE
jgi:hypothetical protein